MAKTRESHTAARRHIIKAEPLRSDFPNSDAATRKNTGKGWREWLRILDAWGAKERKHGETVKYLMEEHGVPGWWAQSITNGFERSRGMRAKHQTLAGSFQVSVSKTMPIGAGKVFRAFAEVSQRNRWLDRGTLKVRTTQKNKTARFDFRDGSRVVAFIEAKERSKATVTIQHEKLNDASAVEEMRTFWRDRLAHLAKLLQG